MPCANPNGSFSSFIASEVLVRYASSTRIAGICVRRRTYRLGRTRTPLPGTDFLFSRQTEERLLSAVPVRLETERNRLNGLQQRLLAAGQSGLHRRKLRFAQTVATLDAMSPLRVLGRGYAVATKGVKHTVVTDAAALKQGDTLHIQFAKGAADCRVTDIEEDK